MNCFRVCRPGSSVAFGETVVWDAASPAGMSKFPEAIEVVIHLAQSRSYRHFPADSREMFDVNVGMTMSLLQWAAAQSKRQAVLPGVVRRGVRAIHRFAAGGGRPGSARIFGRKQACF